ncbi:MAG: hypothetical protein MZU91_07620 [Desulfosudis oleivorans]|nr:hypothetical protein [Desulfosudis oleivorans]
MLRFPKSRGALADGLGRCRCAIAGRDMRIGPIGPDRTDRSDKTGPPPTASPSPTLKPVDAVLQEVAFALLRRRGEARERAQKRVFGEEPVGQAFHGIVGGVGG